ncbi:MAG: hypothetical protein KGM43_04370, partial [Planctomycetota bacterium]|nr:hypothetical protein [Planctomycetota bacterium]
VVVLNDRDPALFRLEHVDKHFFLHAMIFPKDGLACRVCGNATRAASFAVRLRRRRLSGRRRCGSVSPMRRELADHPLAIRTTFESDFPVY